MHYHNPATCAGRPCCVHHPSGHHMATWPQVWRGDRNLMERTCPHGVGHPDPDHLAQVLATRGAVAANTESLHGCDGCCRPPTPESAP
jgi:hypothetical protein